jgi:hypothetical protein
MSSVIVAGDTSGSVTLQAPAVSGSTVLTLPTTSGTMATLTTPSFTTTIGVGGATPSASGAGITFPATQSASTDANTLDDYEEGTWTGAITTTGGSVTIGSQTCTYVKVGRLVVLNGNISVSAISSPTGQCTITGLPFTPASSVVGGSTVMIANANTTTATAVYSEISNTPRIYIAKSTVLSSIADAADLIGATTFIRFSATYQI